jgi:hypothetical protein
MPLFIYGERTLISLPLSCSSLSARHRLVVQAAGDDALLLLLHGCTEVPARAGPSSVSFLQPVVPVASPCPWRVGIPSSYLPARATGPSSASLPWRVPAPALAASAALSARPARPHAAAHLHGHRRLSIELGRAIFPFFLCSRGSHPCFPSLPRSLVPFFPSPMAAPWRRAPGSCHGRRSLVGVDFLLGSAQSLCAVRAAELLPVYAPSFSCAQPHSLSLPRRRSLFWCSVGRASPRRVRRVPCCHSFLLFGPRRSALAHVTIVALFAVESRCPSRSPLHPSPGILAGVFPSAVSLPDSISACELLCLVRRHSSSLYHARLFIVVTRSHDELTASTLVLCSGPLGHGFLVRVSNP